jgi:hypothetical protein
MRQISSAHGRITPQNAITTLFNPWDLANPENSVVQTGREI